MRPRALSVSNIFLFFFTIILPCQGQGQSLVRPGGKAKFPGGKQKYTELTLENGLSVTLVQDTTVPVVTALWAWHTGPAHLSPDNYSLCHLHVATLAESLTRQDTTQALLFDSQVLPEGMLLRARMPADQVFQGLKMLEKALKPGDVRQEEMENGRKAVAEKIQLREAEPMFYLNEELSANHWGKNAFRLNTDGSYLQLVSLAPEALSVFRREISSSENCELLLAGDFDPDTIRAWLETEFSYLGENSAGLMVTEVPKLPAAEGGWRTVVNVYAPAPLIRMIWAGPSVQQDAGAAVAADLFCQAAGLPGSVFYEKLLATGLATSMHWRHRTGAELGQLELQVAPHPDSAQKCMNVLNTLFFYPDWLENTADWDWEGGRQMQYFREAFLWEKSSDWLLQLAGRKISGLPGFPDQYREQIEKLAITDIRAFIENYLLKAPFSGGVLSPRELNLAVSLEKPTPPQDSEEEFSPQILIHKIYFNSNSSRPDTVSMDILSQLADFLAHMTEVNLFVNGYTDGVGNGVHNYQLSIDRAELVKKILVEEYGIGAERLEVRGFGEAFPDYPDDTPEHRALNRRVTFEIKLPQDE